MMRRSMVLVISLAAAAACEQPGERALGPDWRPDLAVSFNTGSVPDPAEVFPGVLTFRSPVSLQAATTVVSIRTAPGPDGIPGTVDDVVFDASFTPRYQRTDGTTSVDYPSPLGTEWSALGLFFEPTSGAVALTTGGSGCLGSQLPAPAPVYPNWAGGVGIDFIGAAGVPATVSRISVDVAGSASMLQAFDGAGNLLGSETADQYRDVLTVSAPGIARADLNGQFWCIATYVEYDDLTPSVIGIIAQIGQYVSSGDVDSGVAGSLTSMLEAANVAIRRGQNPAGSNILQAFINHVAAQSGKNISASAAAALMAWAQALAVTL